MKLSELKAQAAQLGIDKDTARQYGHIGHKATWEAAIADHHDGDYNEVSTPESEDLETVEEIYTRIQPVIDRYEDDAPEFPEDTLEDLEGPEGHTEPHEEALAAYEAAWEAAQPAMARNTPKTPRYVALAGIAGKWAVRAPYWGLVGLVFLFLEAKRIYTGVRAFYTSDRTQNALWITRTVITVLALVAWGAVKVTAEFMAPYGAWLGREIVEAFPPAELAVLPIRAIAKAV